jgi:hypothetical protein
MSEQLVPGITAHERELLLDALDLKATERRKTRMSDESWQRLALIAEGLADHPAHPLLLIARAVDHESAFARFAAYDLIEVRHGISAGWFLSGHLQQLTARVRRSGRWIDTPGGVVLRDLVVEPEREGQPGLSSDVLRGIKPQLIIGKTRAFLTSAADFVRADPDGVAPEERAAGEAAAAAAARAWPHRPIQRGSRGYDDEHYRRIAQVVLEEYAKGDAGPIAMRVAKRYRRRGEKTHVMPGTMRDWMRESERRGFLQRPSAGHRAFLPGWRLKR